MDFNRGEHIVVSDGLDYDAVTYSRRIDVLGIALFLETSLFVELYFRDRALLGLNL